MTIDKETARVISEQQSDPTRTCRSDTVLTEVVAAVPADVLAALAEHEDERVYD